ncbi:MAG: 16S rRNA (guanine(527)-N(7))-methyltransferase RsmG [Rhodospirillales bacterium]|nr:16S rRNA (guanine(527)-N(7))-methyltransferase RsmG [Rhodospirillales bacterium]
MAPASKNPKSTHTLPGVSRETIERLSDYWDLLCKWRGSINLVGPDMGDGWQRHLADSAQLFEAVKSIAGPKFDLGSGGGFPGMVLAIMGITEFTLIESVGKKCVFLRQAARATDTNVDIFQGRIENFKPPSKANLITARALAPLDKLLEYAYPLLAPGGQCVFLKGAKLHEELTESQKRWHMAVKITPSGTDSTGRVVIIEGLEPIHGRNEHALE